MADKKLRQERMASVVQIATAEFFNQHYQDWNAVALPLVEQVFVTPDLRQVEIWISFAPWDADKAKAWFEAVGRHLGELKKWLAGRIELRRFPEVGLKLANPEAAFRLMGIFDTLNGHEHHGSADIGEVESGKEDPADNSH